MDFSQKSGLLWMSGKDIRLPWHGVSNEKQFVNAQEMDSSGSGNR